MKKELNEKEQKDQLIDENENLQFPGYPLYPPGDDIYYVNEKAGDIDPEDLSKSKRRNEVPETMNQKDFIDDMSGSDLDIPGAELDDQQEDIGTEDEENNYYSQADNQDDFESDTKDENQL